MSSTHFNITNLSIEWYLNTVKIQKLKMISLHEFKFHNGVSKTFVVEIT